jgi:hypothetical protein
MHTGVGYVIVTAMVDAGWYQDADDPNWMRWWDGEGWTARRRPSLSGGPSDPASAPYGATTPSSASSPAPAWAPSSGPSAQSAPPSPPGPPPEPPPGQSLASAPPTAGPTPSSVWTSTPPPPPFPAAYSPQQSGAGFFKSLFDFGFTSLITTKIIKVVYIIITIFNSVGAAFGLLFALITMARVPILGILLLIVVPVLWLIYMIIARIFLEGVIIVFRIGEDVQKIANR